MKIIFFVLTGLAFLCTNPCKSQEVKSSQNCKLKFEFTGEVRNTYDSVYKVRCVISDIAANEVQEVVVSNKAKDKSFPMPKSGQAATKGLKTGNNSIEIDLGEASDIDFENLKVTVKKSNSKSETYLPLLY